jgi:hypothetical protein
LPAKIQGKDLQLETWDEITKIVDVSGQGACFNLKRKVESGHLVHMTIPMPMQFRAYDQFAQQYRVWALTRRVVFQEKTQTFSVGVAFIGKRPPQSYEDNPNTFYKLAEHSQEGLWYLIESKNSGEQTEGEALKDRRKKNRHKIPFNIIIQKSEENGHMFYGEPSVTEDISAEGACVLTSLPLQTGDFVRFTCDQLNLSILAVAKGKHIGADNISRLHLEFIDQKFPLEKL